MHYINGEWVDAGSHRFHSSNPATGAALWQGWAAGETQVAAAVAAARAAFPAWVARSLEERQAFLNQFKELMEQQKEALALLIAQEMGKALWDARSEVAAVISKLGFALEAYHERTGEKSRPGAAGTAVLRHRAHGVMAVYGPYNFPAHLPNGHIMPALLAGNTVVFKPSEQTPMVAEWMVKQWEAAGLPAGVMNLVQGERETGIALAAHPVDGILFTGSSATGKALHRQLAGKPEIMLALEMGGNNPLIVGKLSDVQAAVHETLMSAYIGTGQRCTCARRLIVVEPEAPEGYIEQLVQAAVSLTIGAYDSRPEPFMGPLVSLREAHRLVEAQAFLEKLGAQPLLRARMLQEGLPFISPGIVDVTGVENVPDEEYFGPLLQLYRVKNYEEAIAVANRSSYGLSAAIFCDDAALFQELSQKLRVGLVNWNRQTTGASGASPFGGIGQSGNHRPAGYYSADYCAYPVASVEAGPLAMPAQLAPGMMIGKKEA